MNRPKRSTNPLSRFAAGQSTAAPSNRSKVTNPYLKKKTTTTANNATSTTTVTKKAATTNSMEGWLTTKKRGRDDDQIKTDREAVLEARRLSNQKKRSSTAKSKSKSKSKSKPPAKKKKKGVWESDDDDSAEDSEDSFIENEEEEEEEEDETMLEEEFESESDSEEEGIHDDDDEEDSYRKPQSVKKKRNPASSQSQRGITTKTKKERPITKKKKPIHTHSSSEEENDNIPSRAFTKRNAKSNPVNNLMDLLSSDDSDADDDLLHNPYTMPPPKRTSSLTPEVEDEKKEEEGLTSSPYFSRKRTTQTKGSKSRAMILDSDSDSEEEVNDKRQTTTSTTTTTTLDTTLDMGLADTDDDTDDFFDEEPNSKARTEPKPPPNSTTDDNLWVEDRDEAIALSLALAESRKYVSGTSGGGKKRNRLQSKNDKIRDEQKRQNDLQTKTTKTKMQYKSEEDDEEIEEEEQEVDEEETTNDEYIGETQDEKEAISVLTAANNLSGHIIQVLQGWSSSSNTTGDGEGGTLVESSTTSAPPPKENKKNTSMIVDGALALSSLCTGGVGSNGGNGWISHEDMKLVCPSVTLGDYQLIGVNWMALLHRLTFDLGQKKSSKAAAVVATGSRKKNNDGMNVNGVLADEMGLGKTVQTIAFLTWLKRQATRDQQEDRPHIIIVPASVLSNWQREFTKFSPDMVIVKYHGSLTERAELKNRLRRSMPFKAGQRKGRMAEPLDVVLTTFSYFSSEKGDDRSFLRKFDWNYMIVDEAHCLKNPKGARYKNMDNFTTQRRLLLTGTPVQNSPNELMSLLCFLMPLFTRKTGGFDDEDSNDGGARMLEHFVRLEAENGVNKTKGMSAETSEEDTYRKLRQLLAPFVLRRTKLEVLKQLLPPKIKTTEWVSFDNAQRNVYDSILSNHLKSKESSTSHSGHVFTQLRKASHHQLLLRSRHTSEQDIEDLSKQLFISGYFGRHETCTQVMVKKQLELFNDYDIHNAALELIDENACRADTLSRFTLKEDDLFCSPKFIRLKEMLPKLVKEGHRILMFSQWTMCLDLLGCLMDTIGFTFLRLDGQTTISERQDLIDKFNNDSSIPVFLLSTRAGGMGINLTAADTCILHDLDFNPFNDLQAEDRCHRIGQKRPVTVYKLITQDTVDADIFRMQERKAKMNAAILESGKDGESASAKGPSKTETKKETSLLLQTAISNFERRTQGNG